MKSAIKIILLTTVCLMISSCGKTMEDKVIGSWYNYDESITVIFDNDGSYTIEMAPDDFAYGTFTSYESDGLLVINISNNFGGEPSNLTVRFYSDNQIEISHYEDTVVFNRIK